MTGFCIVLQENSELLYPLLFQITDLSQLTVFFKAMANKLPLIHQHKYLNCI